jgi:hypothetical protein
MYRIYFTRNGLFVLQVLRFGLFWQTIQHETFDSFESYSAAKRWSEQVGLNKLLNEQSERELPAVFYGRGAR